MDEKLRATLEGAGFEVKETFLRFMQNEAFYKKYLFGFPEDKVFPQLQEAMDSGDIAAAEKFAHTLKGTSGNLGLTKLHYGCKDLMDVIRSGESEDVIREKYEEVKATYEETASFIVSIR